MQFEQDIRNMHLGCINIIYNTCISRRHRGKFLGGKQPAIMITKHVCKGHNKALQEVMEEGVMWSHIPVQTQAKLDESLDQGART